MIDSRMNSTQDTEKVENAIVERVDTSPGEGVFDIGDHPKVNIISLILCMSIADLNTLSSGRICLR